MTFQIVLNNLEWGIKHADDLSAPRFLIEDTLSIAVTLVLPIATSSELFNLESSSNWLCNFSGGAFTELQQENPSPFVLLP